eukprot:CAMPEP_0181435262 /NCGR_PEP_ID=MMETSP1110-20121109/20241_1 /TAXON_ID=174948 /ORGANISM="Symbiodinium sp., Strain CCMP421" /LENGTH=148 /DNA_ID=CAMNT_0023558789 /DNA_START=406 /DNA_END=852 /DNA_ORIENTATION=+
MELLVQQASPRLMGAAISRLIARNIVALAGHERANLGLEEVREALGLCAGEGAQAHRRLAVGQQGALLVAKVPKQLLIVGAQVAILQIFWSSKRVIREDLHVLAPCQLVHGVDRFGMHASSSRSWSLHRLPVVGVKPSLQLDSFQVRT